MLGWRLSGFKHWSVLNVLSTFRQSRNYGVITLKHFCVLRTNKQYVVKMWPSLAFWTDRTEAMLLHFLAYSELQDWKRPWVLEHSDKRSSKSEVVWLQEGTVATHWRSKEAQKVLTSGRVDWSARLRLRWPLVTCGSLLWHVPSIIGYSEKENCKQIRHFFLCVWVDTSKMMA